MCRWLFYMAEVPHVGQTGRRERGGCCFYCASCPWDCLYLSSQLGSSTNRVSSNFYFNSMGDVDWKETPAASGRRDFIVFILKPFFLCEVKSKTNLSNSTHMQRGERLKGIVQTIRENMPFLLRVLWEDPYPSCPCLSITVKMGLSSNCLS